MLEEVSGMDAAEQVAEVALARDAAGDAGARRTARAPRRRGAAAVRARLVELLRHRPARRSARAHPAPGDRVGGAARDRRGAPLGERVGPPNPWTGGAHPLRGRRSRDRLRRARARAGRAAARRGGVGHRRERRRARGRAGERRRERQPRRRVRIAEGSWFEALPEELRGSLLVVVANPPYIAADEELPESVARWEPADALVSGPTGLEALETIVSKPRRRGSTRRARSCSSSHRTRPRRRCRARAGRRLRRGGRSSTTSPDATACSSLAAAEPSRSGSGG